MSIPVILTDMIAVTHDTYADELHNLRATIVNPNPDSPVAALGVGGSYYQDPGFSQHNIQVFLYPRGEEGGQLGVLLQQAGLETKGELRHFPVPNNPHANRLAKAGLPRDSAGIGVVIPGSPEDAANAAVILARLGGVVMPGQDNMPIFTGEALGAAASLAEAMSPELLKQGPVAQGLALQQILSITPSPVAPAWSGGTAVPRAAGSGLGLGTA